MFPMQCAFCVPPFQIYIGPQEAPFMGYGLLWVMGYEGGGQKLVLMHAMPLIQGHANTLKTFLK